MSIESGWSTALSTKEPSSVRELGLILQRNIHFKWKGDQTWIGFTKRDLSKLVSRIAVFVGISPTQAEKINIVFGDHHRVTKDGPCVALNRWMADFGVFNNCLIVLNRSLEVLWRDRAEVAAARNTEETRLLELGLFDPEEEKLTCELTAKDNLIWCLGEELCHARFILQAGTPKRYRAWLDHYLAIAKKRSYRVRDDYDTRLDEVAANRTVLRLLSYVSENAEYFRQCYLESLARRRIFLAKSPDSAFVKTGYRLDLSSRLRNSLADIFISC